MYVPKKQVTKEIDVIFFFLNTPASCYYKDHANYEY